MPLETVHLNRLCLDDEFAIRFERDQERVDDLAALLHDDPASLEAAVIFQDPAGRLWPGDGHYRRLAHEGLGLLTMRADVRPGDREDAYLFGVSVHARAATGLTRQEKRRAVETLLAWQKRPRWQHLRQREIAALVGCSADFVTRVKKDLAAQSIDQSTDCNEPDIVKIPARNRRVIQLGRAVVEAERIGKRLEKLALGPRADEAIAAFRRAGELAQRLLEDLGEAEAA